MQWKHLLIGLVLFFSFLSHGQKPFYNQQANFLKANNHWVMPNQRLPSTLLDTSIGLEFSSGTGVVMKTAMVSWEGAAAISDATTGKLLFYSNGEQVWNANHVVMPNGDSLLGNSRFSHIANGKIISNIGFGQSTSQGVCIVPVIAEPNKYYLFSLTSWLSNDAGYAPERDFSRGVLFYSVIDMKLNNGLGDIEPGRKNITLRSSDKDTLGEMMTAIPGNNCDIWLVVHTMAKDTFFSYHITKEGINTTPVVSYVPTSLDTIYGGLIKHTRYLSYGAGTYLTKSPDRKKVVLQATPLLMLLCEFDPNTGKLSNPIELDATLEFEGEPCFSPDNSKLYCGNRDSIFQYDISVYNTSSINSSRKDVASGSFYDSVTGKHIRQGLVSMRLFKDIIYLTCPYESISRPCISRINKPNLVGRACGFEKEAIALPRNVQMPSFGTEVVLPISDTFFSPTLDTALCAENLILSPGTVYGNPRWSDGSQKPSLIITEAGVYWIIQNDGCHAYVDTIKVRFYEPANPIISIDKRRLSTTRKYKTYQWILDGQLIQGATDSIFIVQDGGNGYYQVIVSNGNCTDTSDVYEVTNAGETSIDERITEANRILIYPNPTTDIVYIQSAIKVNLVVTSIEGKVLKKQAGALSFSVADFADGTYFIQVLDEKNRLLKVLKFTKTK